MDSDHKRLIRMFEGAPDILGHKIHILKASSTQDGWSSPPVAVIGEGKTSPYVMIQDGNPCLFNYRGKRICVLRSTGMLWRIFSKIENCKED